MLHPILLDRSICCKVLKIIRIAFIWNYRPILILLKNILCDKIMSFKFLKAILQIIRKIFQRGQVEFKMKLYEWTSLMELF